MATKAHGKRLTWAEKLAAEERENARLLRAEMRATAATDSYGSHARRLHSIVLRVIERQLSLGHGLPGAAHTAYGRVTLRYTNLARVIIKIPRCGREIGGSYFELIDPYP